MVPSAAEVAVDVAVVEVVLPPLSDLSCLSFSFVVVLAFPVAVLVALLRLAVGIAAAGSAAAGCCYFSSVCLGFPLPFPFFFHLPFPFLI